MQIFDGQIRFGIHSGQQYATFDDYLSLWKRAEDLGYDWASTFDHFLPIGDTSPEGPCFEGLTLLAAMAAHTSRLRCGIMVVGVTYRNPAVLANIAATIDHVSGGRLELGLGAAWNQMEHEEYGIPFPPIGRRVRMLREATTIVKSLWTEHRTTFEGRDYQITDALCEPKPVQQPRIPLWIGGSGEKLTLRVVAELADGWNTFFGPLDVYRQKLDALAGHCRDVGRNPADIRKSLHIPMLVGETEAEVRERTGGIDGEWNGQRRIAGTPEQCIKQLMPYFKLGVHDFIIGARAPADMRSLELVATKIAPEMKAMGKSVAAAG